MSDDAELSYDGYDFRPFIVDGILYEPPDSNAAWASVYTRPIFELMNDSPMPGVKSTMMLSQPPSEDELDEWMQHGFFPNPLRRGLSAR